MKIKKEQMMMVKMDSNSVTGTSYHFSVRGKGIIAETDYAYIATKLRKLFEKEYKFVEDIAR